MLTITLFPNIKKQGISTVLGWMVQHLKERGVPVFLPEYAAQAMGYPSLAMSSAAMRGTVNLAITLGGDGTLLSTAREIAGMGIPVCGVNLGQLGFLTEIELPELAESLDKIIRGEYAVEERLMLAAAVERGGEILTMPPALNDVVVTKGGFSRMLRLKLLIDGELTAGYAADGLVAATPTGSTGYSLSAGGPIVSPNLNVIVLTPICPHTLNARSLLVSEHEEIRLSIEASHDDIVLTLDGQTAFSLKPDDVIVIKSSPLRALFARLSGHSYYQTLRTKLRRGDQTDNS